MQISPNERPAPPKAIVSPMDALRERRAAEEAVRCCPFKTTPGRLAGQWTNCIHGLVGRRTELLRELEQTNDAIWQWEVDHGRTGVS